MNKRSMLMAAGAGLSMLAACGGGAPGPADPVPVAPAADEQFRYAAVYDCADGRELQALFNHGDPSGTLVRIGASGAMHLAPVMDGDAPSWTDGVNTLTDTMGGEAIWKEGSLAPVTCRGAMRPLPPPAAPGVVRDVTETEAGVIVDLKVGETFSISLSDVPTAGYSWAAVETPDFLKEAGSLGGATTTAQFLPGYAGGNHWIVLVFEATATGQGELELAQKRPWEDEPAPDDRRFRVRVSVK